MESENSNPLAEPPEPPEMPNARPIGNINAKWIRIIWGSIIGLAIMAIIVALFSGGKTKAQAAEEQALAGGPAAMVQQAPSLEATQQQVQRLNQRANELMTDIRDKQAMLRNQNDPEHMTSADITRQLNQTDADIRARQVALEDLQRKQQTGGGVPSGAARTESSGSSTTTIAGGEVPNVSGKPAPWQSPNENPTGQNKASNAVPTESASNPTDIPHLTTTANLDRPPAQNQREPLDFDPATTQTYYVPAGTIIEAVLRNRLEGEGSGAVLLMVTNDVRDPLTQRLYVPAGATVIGSSSQVSNLGQRRLAVTFSRVIVRGVNTVYGIPLESPLAGMNQTGAVGLDGKVNTHVWSVFGSAMAVGLIGGLAQIGNGYSGYGYSPGVELRNGFTMGTGQAAMQILDRYLNRMPTITVKEGKRARIILIHDVPMPDYEEMERRQG